MFTDLDALVSHIRSLHMFTQSCVRIKNHCILSVLPLVSQFSVIAVPASIGLVPRVEDVPVWGEECGRGGRGKTGSWGVPLRNSLEVYSMGQGFMQRRDGVGCQKGRLSSECLQLHHESQRWRRGLSN